MTTVQYISAAWCKRCHVVKPDVVRYCTIAGADLTILDFEEMEEEEKAKIASLPEIRMKNGDDWVIFTSSQLEEWKTAITHTAVITTDF